MALRWTLTHRAGGQCLTLRLEHVMPLAEPLKVRQRVVVIGDDVIALCA
jgi:hypothetical protein